MVVFSPQNNFFPPALAHQRWPVCKDMSAILADAEIFFRHQEAFTENRLAEPIFNEDTASDSVFQWGGGPLRGANRTPLPYATGRRRVFEAACLAASLSLTAMASKMFFLGET